MTAQLLASLFPGFLERYGARLGPEYVRVAERFRAGLGAVDAASREAAVRRAAR